MKPRSPSPATATAPAQPNAIASQLAAAAVRTGEHCPQTGWWYPLQTEPAVPAQLPSFVGQGSVMPAAGGFPSLWLPSRVG